MQRELLPLVARVNNPAALADLAVRALVTEAELTPKPALVDRRGTGAHRDLDLGRLLASAAALRSDFERMARCAQNRRPTRDLRQELGAIGRDAEAAMLAATGGSNAHRGAIWTLGLLLAALAMSAPGAPLADVAASAAALAQLPDLRALTIISNGLRACTRYGVEGARGEARAGFPHVIRVGLPALRKARLGGADETTARLDALMAIMGSLEDTCLLHRGGRSAVEAAQSGAQEVLGLGGTATPAGWSRLLKLDADLMQRWVSPGGSADLLSACLLLDEATVERSWSN
jgi:triphosphoribosyl-dephospho-CoA synthase